MDKLFKRTLALISLVLMMTVTLGASQIDNIDVRVRIDKDGRARIDQEWKVYNDDGTEYYIPIQNLNHMELENFRVSSQNDGNYGWTQTIPWDINAGFDGKQYRYGIVTTNRGLELCWGKTHMGEAEYLISFDYKNAVQSFSDYDGFLIRFINDGMSPAPKNVSVTIELDGVDLSQENARIWSFGNNGNIVFKDGKVLARDDNYSSQSSMTIMMSFEKGLLEPTYQGTGTFEDLREMAFEGSAYDIDEGEETGNFFTRNSFWIPIIIMLIVARTAGKIANYARVKNIREVDFKNPPYYRDELLENFIPAIYFMAYQKSPPNNLVENTVSAYFLKWIKDGALKTDEYSNLREDTQQQSLEIAGDPNIRSESELKLWQTIVLAAGENGILEASELESYFKKNYKKYQTLFDDLYKEGRDYLVEKGMLTNGRKMLFTESGKQECANAYAMRRFFKDFTLINERQVKEVALWDYYLIIATIYGMGEEVSKAFEKLVPEYKYAEETQNGLYISPYQMYYLTRNMGRSTSRGYNSGLSANSSRGFGGGASFGGGGGFSGGGSGGGSR